MQTKEQIYDDQINPLMAQIIGICKRHGIAMFATYHLPDDEQDSLRCTTHLPDGDGKIEPIHAKLYNLAGPYHSGPTMITTRNADGKVTNMTAII